MFAAIGKLIRKRAKAKVAARVQKFLAKHAKRLPANVVQANPGAHLLQQMRFEHNPRGRSSGAKLRGN